MINCILLEPSLISINNPSLIASPFIVLTVDVTLPPLINLLHLYITHSLQRLKGDSKKPCLYVKSPTSILDQQCLLAPNKRITQVLCVCIDLHSSAFIIILSLEIGLHLLEFSLRFPARLSHPCEGVVAVLPPCIPLIDAIFVVLPISLNNLYLPKRVEFEALIADHIGKVPFLHGFFIIIALKLVQFVVEGSIHGFKTGVYLVFQRVGEALDTWILQDILPQILEDDLEFLHQLLVQLLGLIAQMVQLLLLVLYLIILFDNHLLLPEDLILGVNDRTCQGCHRSH